MASARTERQTLPSDSSSTRTGPGSTLRAAASSFAAAARAHAASAPAGVCERVCAQQRGGASEHSQTQPYQLVALWQFGRALSRRERGAPRKEREARKDGATTTPVTSKCLSASGAPEPRRSSSALGQALPAASPPAARAGARLRKRATASERDTPRATPSGGAHCDAAARRGRRSSLAPSGATRPAAGGARAKRMASERSATGCGADVASRLQQKRRPVQPRARTTTPRTFFLLCRTSYETQTRTAAPKPLQLRPGGLRRAAASAMLPRRA